VSSREITDGLEYNREAVQTALSARALFAAMSRIDVNASSQDFHS
jgi:hypothetical protein